MQNWTKESALVEIKILIAEIDSLYKERHTSSAHSYWLIRTITFLKEVFGDNSIYTRNIVNIAWGYIGETIQIRGHEMFLDPSDAIKFREDATYRKQLDSAKGVLQAALHQLSKVESIEKVYEGKDTSPEASLIIKVINLAERKLRKVIRAIPTKEKEVQEAFETLLIGADVEYSREADSIEYSTKTYKPDFTIIKSNLAIEIKLCPKAEREKEIIAEINDDILAYKTKYNNILFVIYDCGFIRDLDRFIEHFEKNENVIVKVVKH
jgi:hypothetical protein